MRTDAEIPEIAQGFHDPRVVDRGGRLVATEGLAEDAVAQVVRVMDALFRWRSAEQRASAASRGAGTLPVSAFSASPAAGPEMRTTAIATGGRPEERAKMVSRRGSDIAAQVSAGERSGQELIKIQMSAPQQWVAEKDVHNDRYPHDARQNPKCRLGKVPPKRQVLSIVHVECREQQNV